MTLGARLRRRLATVLIALSIAGFGVPAAHAAEPAHHAGAASSPHQAVNRFWKLYDTGNGGRAYKALQPSCRNAKDQRELQEASNKAAKLPGSISIEKYHEKISHGKAAVSYVISYHLHGKAIPIGKSRDQKWVLQRGHWYVTCHQS